MFNSVNSKWAKLCVNSKCYICNITFTVYIHLNSSSSSSPLGQTCRMCVKLRAIWIHAPADELFMFVVFPGQLAGRRASQTAGMENCPTGPFSSLTVVAAVKTNRQESGLGRIGITAAPQAADAGCVCHLWVTKKSGYSQTGRVRAYRKCCDSEFMFMFHMFARH